MKNNWSSEESESVEDAKATPAPILKINEPPPIKPVILGKPMTKDIKFPMTKDIKFPMTEDIKFPMNKDINFPTSKLVSPIQTQPQFDPFTSTSDSESFESFESIEEIKVKDGSILVDPKPLTKEEVVEIQATGSRSKDKASPAAVAAAERGAPIKVPFIPKSGPKVEVGTVLKPGGFNGRKPVLRPRQVQSLPYETWAESPLSMAPKKPKKNETSEPEKI